MSDELRDQLEALAGRGRPAGADAVLASARRAAGRRPASWVAAVAAGLAVALAAGGLALVDDDTPPQLALGPTAARLVSFDSCGAFLDDVRKEAAAVVGPWGLPGGNGVRLLAGGPVASRVEGDAAPTAATAATAAPSAPSDTSTTNVQEVGVDEPDVVKTNGSTIFAMNGGTVRAVAARGAPRLLGSLPVSGEEALLVGDRLLVLGSGYGTAVPLADAPGSARPAIVAGEPSPIRPSGSVITIVDVADPAAMRVVSRVELDGSYLAARSADGVARVVLQSSPSNLRFQTPTADTPEAKALSLAHNQDVIRRSTLEDWTPSALVTDATGRTVRSTRPLGCDNAFRPVDNAGFGMLTLLTLDPKDPAATTSASVRADGQLVYASKDRLYVATNAWGRVVDDRVVEPAPRTEVHAFDISGRDDAHYLGTGTVRGTVLNQFAFSADKGHLRVATTDPTNGGESFVTVLAERGGGLAQEGIVGGLGRGERIQAVRFLGDLGYVVTFRQTDPLYVVDLADPANPRLRGELHIPGYSAYLHPLGGDRLLGIGQEATPEGRRLGSQVSLFDVSDPADPRQLDRLALGTTTSSSQAEYDHHAFLWWPAERLAMLPIASYDQRGVDASVVVVRVTADGIDEVGRVRHPGQQGAQIERSLVVGDRLFTLSAGGILASDLRSLADEGWVPFPAS